MIEFTVPGTPHPQGSKVRGRYGGIREANPNTAPWRGTVAAAAAQAMNGRDLITGPVTVSAHFTFVRPQHHYGTGRNADRIRKSAPARPASKPDLDKLCRAVADAITGIVIRDDAQVVDWLAHKQYGPHAQADIAVWPVGTTAGSAWVRMAARTRGS